MILVKLIVWQNVNVKTNGPGRNANITANPNTNTKSARMSFFAWRNVRNFAICAMKETVITWTQLKCSSMGSGKQVLFNAAGTRRYVNVKTNGPKRNARSAMPKSARRAKSVKRSVKTLAIYVIWQQPQVRNSTITFDQYRYRFKYVD